MNMVIASGLRIGKVIIWDDHVAECGSGSS